jgi:DNA replication and repair protein RecF
LKQRNQLLRYGKLSGLEQQLRPWDDELSVCAAQIHELRKQHVETLSPLIENKFEEMALVPGLDVIYKSGWDDSSVVYEEYLAKNFARDRALGYTKGGPHRADLRFMLDGLPATERLSRGQSKMLVCALKLVQGKILASAQRSEQEVVYLVDDLPSELDAQNREVFLSQLVGSKAQVFVTAVDDSSIPKRYVSDLNDSAMFHVKHGSFSRTR